MTLSRHWIALKSLMNLSFLAFLNLASSSACSNWPPETALKSPKIFSTVSLFLSSLFRLNFSKPASFCVRIIEPVAFKGLRASFRVIEAWSILLRSVSYLFFNRISSFTILSVFRASLVLRIYRRNISSTVWSFSAAKKLILCLIIIILYFINILSARIISFFRVILWI